MSALPDALFLLRWQFQDGADSPCINVGSDVLWTNTITQDPVIPSLDLLFTPRMDGIIDMGAYEF